MQGLVDARHESLHCDVMKLHFDVMKLLSTRRSTLVLGGECNRTSVSTLLAQLALC